MILLMQRAHLDLHLHLKTFWLVPPRSSGQSHCYQAAQTLSPFPGRSKGHQSTSITLTDYSFSEGLQDKLRKPMKASSHLKNLLLFCSFHSLNFNHRARHAACPCRLVNAWHLTNLPPLSFPNFDNDGHHVQISTMYITRG